MAELKTKKNRASVAAFLNGIEPEQRRKDCKTIARMMKEATGEKPAMWGKGIVGFGSYHHRYASGREGDWFLTGFAPRKQDLTIYLGTGRFRQRAALLKKLGKHRTGKSCLYIKKLADIDLDVLRELIDGCAAAKEEFGGC
jgi:hypothetical protein